ncbi:MAG: hypothetical protein N3B18_04860, partial [Desulfobacterota bacterium]|nr:hypothetical protein [Thermodesulfobacteriota bacterium]
MIVSLVVITIIAGTTIVLCCIAASQRYLPVDQTLRLSTPLFATWLVASAVWGPYFLAIRVPGLFDITIERILFGCVLFIL